LAEVCHKGEVVQWDELRKRERGGELLNVTGSSGLGNRAGPTS
jgi:hypothetical protein